MSKVLTPELLKKALKHFNMSQKDLGLTLGVSPRQVSSWATGAIAIPEYVKIWVLLYESNNYLKSELSKFDKSYVGTYV